MRKNIKKFAGIVLCIGMFTGCAQTPDSSLVKPKGSKAVDAYTEADDVSGSKGEASESKNDDGSESKTTIRNLIDAPQNYKSHVEDDSAKLVVNTDASVEIPEVEKISAISVTAAEVTQELLDRITNAFFSEAKLYTMDSYYVKTKDEIGELARAFNELAKNLESKVYELQMAAKKQEDFTANFAHELKTPMTSIIGYADTLYQKKMSEDEVHSAAGVILNEGMRLEALSFKLLELITLDKNDFRLEETRISEIIADCVETAHEAARKHNTEIVYSADEAWVWLEYDLFKTMLLNLIDNAVKSGGSKVDVSGRLISHSIYRIAVSDNGRGIPPEDIERITEAFYMVDKSRSRSEHGAGLGLALALVSRIAKLHDTKIHYESESGKGTKVYFDMKAEALDEK